MINTIIYYGTFKMEPTDVKSSTHIDLNVENNNKDLKL